MPALPRSPLRRLKIMVACEAVVFGKLRPTLRRGFGAVSEQIEDRLGACQLAHRPGARLECRILGLRPVLRHPAEVGAEFKSQTRMAGRDQLVSHFASDAPSRCGRRADVAARTDACSVDEILPWRARSEPHAGGPLFSKRF